MQLKKMSEDDLDYLAGLIDSEGAEYMLLGGGGGIDPEDYLDNEKDIKTVRNAIDIVQEYLDTLPSM